VRCRPMVSARSAGVVHSVGCNEELRDGDYASSRVFQMAGTGLGAAYESCFQ